MADNQLDILIRVLGDTAKAKEVAAELNKVGKAVENAADESERYNAVLKKQAEAMEFEAKSSARALKIAEAKKLNEQERAVAAEELAKLTKTYSQAEIDAALVGKKGMEDVTGATDKAFTSKQQLKAAIKQLGHEFPILGQLGRMALNPITLVVAGITGAFVIWNARVRELQRSLEGIDLDALEKHKKGVDAIAQGWRDVAEAAMKAREAYNSADSVGERALKGINDEFNAKIKNAKTDQEKAVLEDERDRRLAAQRQKNIEALKAESDAKMKQAESIKVASAEEDDATQRQLQSNKAKAQKDLEERQQRRSDLADMEAGLPGMNPVAKQAAYYEFYKRYGNNASIADAYAMEDAGIAEAKDIIGRADAFDKRRPERDRLRAYRGELIEGAKKSTAQAETLGLSEPSARASAAAASADRWGAVGGVGGLVASAAAGADAIRGGGKATSDQANAINQLAAMLNLKNQNLDSILAILARMNDTDKMQADAIKRIESQVNANNARP